MLFTKVLIANRGEIAVRVLRTCRSLGIQTVAVHSDADADALHVRLADESVRIGPAPSTESYLRQDRILEAAAATGAEAVHPGYGFLSENAGFARAVRDAGLTWIGPSPEAMEKMGDKVNARANAVAAGVPVAPGSNALVDADEAAEVAREVGYPVMLKASAGGGGIGMRVVRGPEDIREQFESATAQAASAFGVPDVFLEKFIERPRHIEVQVLGDQHGNVVHLYERECSIQRRHQKLVEEAPSPALTPQQREEIGRKAVDLARHVGYSSAGTMEFLYQDGAFRRDASGDAPEPSAAGDGRFFFNEMNTRLQVEHPVTELVTGIDLVRWQLRVAAGEPLDFEQSDVKLHGHAFECRINAEDPLDDFRPSPGTVRRLRLPDGPGVRCDGGIYEGWTVPAVYDSMVLKLITHADDREADLAAMQAALAGLELEGFATNQRFHEALFAHPRFRAGDVSTRFLEEHDVLAEARAGTSEAARRRAAALVAVLRDHPGGGLAGIHLEQHLPAVRDRRPGTRDWRAA